MIHNSNNVFTKKSIGVEILFKSLSHHTSFGDDIFIFLIASHLKTNDDDDDVDEDVDDYDVCKATLDMNEASVFR